MRRSLRCSRYTWNDRTKSHGFNTSRRNAIASWLYEELIRSHSENVLCHRFSKRDLGEDRFASVSLHETTKSRAMTFKHPRHSSLTWNIFEGMPSLNSDRKQRWNFIWLRFNECSRIVYCFADRREITKKRRCWFSHDLTHWPKDHSFVAILLQQNTQLFRTWCILLSRLCE